MKKRFKILAGVGLSLILFISIFSFSVCALEEMQVENKEQQAQTEQQTIPEPTPVPVALPKRGIDVSKWNGDIDWQRVKNSGIDFAIIRATYGWETWDKQTDRKFIQNINGAKSVGMPIGAYHYSYARNVDEALKEADFFIDRLHWAKWEYPVFFDFEDKCQLKLSNEERTNIAYAFMEKVENAGYYIGMYANLNWVTQKLHMDRLNRFDLWIARWNDFCGCPYNYGMWQYASDGCVDGINGRVDMNLAYKDYPAIMKELHLNGF